MTEPTHRSKHDVVVVGAGLAGLTAARTLTTARFDVVVLEARGRAGGRLKNQTLGAGEDVCVDLGAQWIASEHTHVLELVEEFDLEIVPQYDTGTLQVAVCGEVYEGKHLDRALPETAAEDLLNGVERIETLRQEIPLEAPHETERADPWDGTTLETWSQKTFETETARRTFDAVVHAEFCVEPAAVSLLQFLSVVHASGGLAHLASEDGGAEEYWLTGGCQQLSRALADELTGVIQIGEPVRAIDWRDSESITLTTDSGTYVGSHAIVAIPPVLAGRIDYEPPLPARREVLTQRTPMGSVIKWFAVYDRPFWREDGYSGAVLADDGLLVEAHDATPPGESIGILVGFVAGKTALQWSEHSVSDRRAQIEDALVRYFGSRAGNSVEYIDVAWSQEPWSMGGYNGFATPGTMTACGDAIRDPVGRVHWAGSETATEWCGYMEGAVRSGKRAAAEVQYFTKRPS